MLLSRRTGSQMSAGGDNAALIRRAAVSPAAALGFEGSRSPYDALFGRYGRGMLRRRHTGARWCWAMDGRRAKNTVFPPQKLGMRTREEGTLGLDLKCFYLIYFSLCQVFLQILSSQELKSLGFLPSRYSEAVVLQHLARSCSFLACAGLNT